MAVGMVAAEFCLRGEWFQKLQAMTSNMRRAFAAMGMRASERRKERLLLFAAARNACITLRIIGWLFLMVTVCWLLILLAQKFGMHDFIWKPAGLFLTCAAGLGYAFVRKRLHFRA